MSVILTFFSFDSDVLYLKFLKNLIASSGSRLFEEDLPGTAFLILICISDFSQIFAGAR